MQITQRGIAGTEIIHTELEPLIVQPLQRGLRRFNIAHNRAFSNFQIQQRRIAAMLTNQLVDLAGQVSGSKLTAWSAQTAACRQASSSTK